MFMAGGEGDEVRKSIEMTVVAGLNPRDGGQKYLVGLVVGGREVLKVKIEEVNEGNRL